MQEKTIQAERYSLAKLTEESTNNYTLHIDGHSFTMGFQRVTPGTNGYFLWSEGRVVGFVREDCNVPDKIMNALEEIRKE